MEEELHSVLSQSQGNQVAPKVTALGYANAQVRLIMDWYQTATISELPQIPSNEPKSNLQAKIATQQELFRPNPNNHNINISHLYACRRRPPSDDDDQRGDDDDNNAAAAAMCQDRNPSSRSRFAIPKLSPAERGQSKSTT